MKYTYLYITAFVLLILGLNGCTDPPEFPDVPVVEFESMSSDNISFNNTPLTIGGQNDTVFFKIKFEDGNGDIGYKADEGVIFPCNICDLTSDTSCLKHPTRDLFLTDRRDGCLNIFTMPFVEDNTTRGGVSGTVNIDVFSVCCKDNVSFPCGLSPTAVTDTLIYDIQIRDRAGNFSNVVQSPPIYVRCDM